MLAHSERLGDLVELTNDVDIPQLRIHVKCDIMVTIEPSTSWDLVIPCFTLAGNETIADVKRLAFDHMKQYSVWNDSVCLGDCRLYYDGSTIVSNEDMSLYGVCLTENECFDPMVHSVFFSMTIDSKEAFVMSGGFNNTIIAIICINSVFMAIEHYGASDRFMTILDVTELLFNTIYSVEMVIKFYCLSTIGSNSGLGYGDSAQSAEKEVSCCGKVGYYSSKAFKNYWKTGSNRFDLSICIFSWVSLFIEAVGVNLKVLRIFRAMRLTRVMRKMKSVRKILDASSKALRPMLNIL